MFPEADPSLLLLAQLDTLRERVGGAVGVGGRPGSVRFQAARRGVMGYVIVIVLRCTVRRRPWRVVRVRV